MNYLKLVSLTMTGTLVWAGAAITAGTPTSIVIVGGMLLNALALALGSLENREAKGV